MRRAVLAALLAGGLACAAHAQTGATTSTATDPNTLPASQDPLRTANGLAQTPPMGWNSWNHFACRVDEAAVRGAADALVASGMAAAGYRYVVIDDCWQGARDRDGFITEDRARFPSGLRALADYVHGKGLLFGVYSDAGAKTCGGRPGSAGHEFQDARRYADWGVDYLKYDWCSTGTRNAEEAYALMADALRATGRPIVFSLCEWGTSKPWLWAARIGDLWRTTADIADRWSGRRDYTLGVTDIVDLNAPLWPFAGPGHWNDPDMLEVGQGGLTDVEARAHFSLWAEMAAPLIAGHDPAHMTAAARDILLNREVIAVDQDPLGAQGRRVWKDGGREVWSKPMADGGRAVLLWNRGDAPAEITAEWSALDLPPAVRLQGRDLWAHRDLGPLSRRWSAVVPPHGVEVVRLSPGAV